MRTALPLPNPAFTTPAYRVPRHPASIDLRLDGNEGQGVPESVLSALRELSGEGIRTIQPLLDWKLESQKSGRFNRNRS